MTTYAHITTDGTIDQVGALPALWLGPTRWHDWRGDPETWSAQPADVGWLPVVESPRPDDTGTDTHEPTYTVDGATVVQTWTARPWTAEELAAQAEQAAYEAQQATDRAILDATAALMADAHTDGEPWTQPTGAANAYPPRRHRHRRGQDVDQPHPRQRLTAGGVWVARAGGRGLSRVGAAVRAC